MLSIEVIFRASLRQLVYEENPLKEEIQVKSMGIPVWRLLIVSNLHSSVQQGFHGFLFQQQVQEPPACLQQEADRQDS